MDVITISLVCVLTLSAAIVAFVIGSMCRGPLRGRAVRHLRASLALSLGVLFGAITTASAQNSESSESGESPQAETAPAELSVAPAGPAAKTQFPADRPEWITSPPKAEGKAYLVVNSGPWKSRHECDRELERQLRKEVNAYINDYIGNRKAASLIGYEAATIERQFGSSEPSHSYAGTLISPTVGEMHEVARLLVIEEVDRREIDNRWRQVVASSRLASTGLIAAGVLGLLMVVLGFLKADTATRGFYTGRLRLLSLAIVSAMIAAGVFIARAIPWM